MKLLIFLRCAEKWSNEAKITSNYENVIYIYENITDFYTLLQLQIERLVRCIFMEM